MTKEEFDSLKRGDWVEFENHIYESTGPHTNGTDIGIYDNPGNNLVPTYVPFDKCELVVKPQIKTGIELITEEKEEQISKHGRTLKEDRAINNHYQLSEAAGMMCHLSTDDFGCPINDLGPPTGWDAFAYHKMMSKPYKERLIIAGALIAAEIDRIGDGDI